MKKGWTENLEFQRAALWKRCFVLCATPKANPQEMIHDCLEYPVKSENKIPENDLGCELSHATVIETIHSYHLGLSSNTTCTLLLIFKT
jgi:hypothetical protein